MVAGVSLSAVVGGESLDAMLAPVTSGSEPFKAAPNDEACLMAFGRGFRNSETWNWCDVNAGACESLSEESVRSSSFLSSSILSSSLLRLPAASALILSFVAMLVAYFPRLLC